jgi:hypothetical protein
MKARPHYLCLSGAARPNLISQELKHMRAEAEALVEAIKQSVGLLRRHL